MPSSLKALAFAGVLYGTEEDYARALGLLCTSFGPVLRETAPVPWTSHYYEDELGPRILRRLVFFERLVLQEDLARLKLLSCKMERGLSVEGKRKVNIDPGYLTMPKVVMASTKDYSHRIYLGQGIFAELTLYFMQGSYRPLPFTYNDYKDEAVLSLFAEMREAFRKLNTPETNPD